MIQDSAYPQMGVLYLMDALRKKGMDSENFLAIRIHANRQQKMYFG